MIDFYFARKLAGTFLFTRRTTPRRFLNLCRILFQHYVTRPAEVKGKPVRLIIDTCNLCNLRCPLCPTGQGRTERARGTLGLEDFKRIIAELGDCLYEADLYNWGEPLLNKELPAMIACASAAGVRTTISSNLNLLTPDTAEALVKSGLDQITVSLDGTDQESYGKYRIGGDFSRVAANVKLMADTKARLGSATPHLVWQYLVMAGTEAGIPEARASWKKLGFDELHLRPVRCDMAEEIKLPDAEKISRTSSWLPKEQALSRYDYSGGRSKTSPSTCLFLWTQAVVHWNGAVTPCCSIYEESHDFGNMFSDGGFMAVWNNRKYRMARESVAKMEPYEGHVCSYCIKNGFIDY